MAVIIGYMASVLIGFTLGLIGGGGSILSVPILVYLFGIDPVLATAYSLFVVGISSFVGAFNYMRKGLLNYKTALAFAVPSIMAVYLTRKFLVPAIPDRILTLGRLEITSDFLFIVVLVIVMLGLSLLSLNLAYQGNKKHLKVFLLVTPAAIMVFVVRQFIIPALPHDLVLAGNFTLTRSMAIMILFAVVMVLASLSMIRGKHEETGSSGPDRLFSHSSLIVGIGILVGSVTGLVGAGGGFLIIPALVMIAGLEVKQAVGTSLLIIAVNSLAGFLGDLKNENIHWVFLFGFTFLAITGIFIGTWISGFVDGRKLKKIFGWFILAMGIYILAREVFLR